MFEFWSTMSSRVERRSSITVRTTSFFRYLECLFRHAADLNPVWDQIIYIPGMSPWSQFQCCSDQIVQCIPQKRFASLCSLKLDLNILQSMFMEVMDYQHLTKVRVALRSSSRYRSLFRTAPLALLRFLSVASSGSHRPIPNSVMSPLGGRSSFSPFSSMEQTHSRVIFTVSLNLSLLWL